MRLQVATDVKEIHCVTACAEADAGTGVAAEVEIGRRIAAEPKGLEGCGFRVEFGLGINAGLHKDDRLTRSDARGTEDRNRDGVGVRVVVHRPAREVHGGRAVVGHFEPVNGKRGATVAAGPRSHFSNDEIRGSACARNDGQIVSRAGVRGSADGGVIN